MSRYIKRKREEAGLTQAELAERVDVSVVSVQNWESGRCKVGLEKYGVLSEVLNVPVDQLIKEMLIELDNERKHLDKWPYFLFDDDTNRIVDSLHLNMSQQNLFGILYIYDSQYLEWENMDYDAFIEDLKKVPFEFIDKVGSIQFMNQADGLYKVIKHVKTDFLLKNLKLKPEEEFNVKRLSKDMICEFIDGGYKIVDMGEDGYDDALKINTSMRKARIILPLLEKHGPIHVTDGWWSNPIREDIPEVILSGILQMCGFKPELWKDGYYKRNFNTGYIMHGIETVTDFYEGKDSKFLWKINEKGKRLLKWFQGE